MLRKYGLPVLLMLAVLAAIVLITIQEAGSC